MDAFFASVEQRDNPALRGKPVLVGGAGRRGVVAAASYEARRYGCHSAQPMSVALRRCPEAIVVPPRGRAYAEASERVFELFHGVTPLVEPLSIDEAFLDVTGSERLAGTGREIAVRLRSEIEGAVRLTASVGVASNKFLAKLASDMDKPDGLTEIPESRIDEVLLPLSVRRIPGIGPSAEARLARIGIRTVSDVRRIGPDLLSAQLGTYGEHLYALAHGRDERPVVPDAKAKSISQECTFATDLQDPDDVRAVIVGHVESVARRLRRQGLAAGVASLKIRYGAFETISRRTTLPEPSDATSTLLAAAQRIFDTWVDSGYQPVRLIGFGTSSFTDGEGQLSLFQDPAKDRTRRLDKALDALKDRFGHRSIGRAAGSLRDDGRADGFGHEEGPDRADR